MKAFRFRLQPVQDLRERELDAAQIAHAAAARQAEDVRQFLKTARSRMIALERHDHGSAPFRAHQREQQWNALLQQKEECAGLESALAQALAEAENLRLELVAAQVKHDTLARLSARQQQAHRHDSLRREQVALDEIATAAFARRRLSIAP